MQFQNEVVQEVDRNMEQSSSESIYSESSDSD